MAPRPFQVLDREKPCWCPYGHQLRADRWHCGYPGFPGYAECGAQLVKGRRSDACSFRYVVVPLDGKGYLVAEIDSHEARAWRARRYSARKVLAMLLRDEPDLAERLLPLASNARDPVSPSTLTFSMRKSERGVSRPRRVARLYRREGDLEG
jgi:hypothetical protein